MNITAGRRTARVTIHYGTAGQSPSGQPIVTWVAGGFEYASCVEVSGSERLAQAQLGADVETCWEIPYRADLDPDRVDVPKLRRLVYEGRTYNIRRATMRERHEGRGIRLFTSASTGGV